MKNQHSYLDYVNYDKLELHLNEKVVRNQQKKMKGKFLLDIHVSSLVVLWIG